MNITFAEIIELDTDDEPKPIRLKPADDPALKAVPEKIRRRYEENFLGAPVTQHIDREPEKLNSRFEDDVQPAPRKQRQRRQKVEQENVAGEGFLAPDGKTVISMWDARKLFWQTFGMNVQEFYDERGVMLDDALLAVGMIYVDKTDTIQVGMRGSTLANVQFRALSNYLETYLQPSKKLTILGLWYDLKSFALQKEEVLYQGDAQDFYTIPVASRGTPDVGKKNTSVPNPYKAGSLGITFDYELARFADFTEDILTNRVQRAKDQAIRRKRIKEHRLNVELLKYKHYGVLPIIKFENEEWALGTEEMADQAADDAAGQAFDEGIFNVEFLQQHLDGDKVANAFADDDDRYMEDAKRDLEEEAEENPDEEGNIKEVTDAEVATKAEEKQQEHYDEIKSDPLGYLQGIFGQEELGKAIVPYLDREAVIEAAVNEDGRGNFLSGYDSEEHDLDDIDSMELIDLPEDVLDELGVTWRYRYHIYAYRLN